MVEAEEAKRLITVGIPTLVAWERPRRDFGFHFTDQVAARGARHRRRRGAHRPDLHRPLDHHPAAAARRREPPCRKGSARYEAATGRVQSQAAEANLGDAIRRIETQGQANAEKPAWQQALTNARLPLYDVHWPQAVVLEETRRQRPGRPGRRPDRAADRSAQRHAQPQAVRRRLCPRHRDRAARAAKGKNAKAPPPATARAELRVRPTVQGAAVVLENQTGRVLAMAGGFSYPLSQLNRVTQSQRQPGSAIKPISYLAALAKGLQPNTLVRDEPVTLPPIGGANARTRHEDYWTPQEL